MSGSLTQVTPVNEAKQYRCFAKNWLGQIRVPIEAEQPARAETEYDLFRKFSLITHPISRWNQRQNDTHRTGHISRMNLKTRKHWLFDMDGTLTRAMHDFDAMRAELALPAGAPILEALAAMDPAEARVKHAALDAMELRMAADATQQPGSHELLMHLQEQGARLGIVTRNGKQIAKATLAACGLDSFFTDDSIISRDCCTAKPDPAGVRLLLLRWSADADDAVMVGDYLFDLQAGHSAGVATVHMDIDSRFEWPEYTSVSVNSLQALTAQLL